MRFYRWLRCFLLHRRAYGDRQWELDRWPGEESKPLPALWRVWRYCQICGRGWTYMVEQKSNESFRYPDGYEAHNKPLPMIQDCTFRDPDGKNPRKS